MPAVARAVRPLAVVFVFGLLTGCAVPSASPRTEVDSRETERSSGLERGARLNGAGRHEDAERVFRDQLRSSPDSVPALLGLGRSLMGRGNDVLASLTFEKVLALEPDNVAALNASGVIRDRESRHDEAQSLYRQALDIAADSSSVLSNLGYSLYLDGRAADALPLLERAVASESAPPIAFANLALVRFAVGDTEGAARAFEKVGSRRQALNNLGYLQLLADDEIEARRNLQLAATVSSSYYSAPRRNLQLLEGTATRSAMNGERSRLVVRSAIDDEIRADDDALPLQGEPAPTIVMVPQSLASVESEPEEAASTSNSGDASAERTGGRERPTVPSDDPGNRPVPETTRSLVRSVQAALSDRDFDVGAVDGILGENSVRAIRLFKVARRLPIDGEITPNLLDALGIGPLDNDA